MLMQNPAAPVEEIIKEGTTFLTALEKLKTKTSATLSNLLDNVKKADELGEIKRKLAQVDADLKAIDEIKAPGSVDLQKKAKLQKSLQKLDAKFDKKLTEAVPALPDRAAREIAMEGLLASRANLLQKGEVSALNLKDLAIERIRTARDLLTKLPADSPEVKETWEAIRTSHLTLANVQQELLNIQGLYAKKLTPPTHINTKMVDDFRKLIEDNRVFLEKNAPKKVQAAHPGEMQASSNVVPKIPPPPKIIGKLEEEEEDEWD